MIQLDQDRLRFSFSGVHRSAALTIELQRTLRIPDDAGSYALPPGLGRFPVRHVDDYSDRLPASWLRRGGVMVPMYQAEALWLDFESSLISTREAFYPFAIKVAAGKVNAVNGEPWRAGLDFEPQGYVVVPSQPWLDGFVVEEGVVRQFVAMPLGAGYSAEEQLSGEAEWGGLQLEVFPMKRAVFERRFPKRRRRSSSLVYGRVFSDVAHSTSFQGMALAPGGRMQQQIVADEYKRSDWDLQAGQRCFVHLANSMLWRAITGSEPPHPPVTSAEYTKAGLPWFDWYTEQPSVSGAKKLAGLSSVKELGEKKGQMPLFENESGDPAHVVAVGPAKRPPGKGVRLGVW